MLPLSHETERQFSSLNGTWRLCFAAMLPGGFGNDTKAKPTFGHALSWSRSPCLSRVLGTPKAQPRNISPFWGPSAPKKKSRAAHFGKILFDVGRGAKILKL